MSATLYRWHFEPAGALAIAALAGAYVWRFRSLDERSPLDRLRAVSFGAGLVVLALALVSPVASLAEDRLFSAHMVQHLLLVDIAPILLLLGLSRPLLRPLTRLVLPVERSLGRLAHPLAALVLLTGVVWTWHVAKLYELALDHGAVHAIEHVTFFWAGVAFWWFVIEPVPPRHRLAGMGMVGYVTAAKLLLGALGVGLAFSTSALYEHYEQLPRTWGLSPVEDLNIGGVVMLVEQSIVLAIFFAILFARMLERSEQAQQRRERLTL